MQYVVGLGSNLGSRRACLSAALTRIEEHTNARVLCVSSLYETDAVGPPQPRYFNAAVRLASELSPHAFLRALLALEAELGRVRRERWAARTLDLDILWAETSVHDDVLTLPHPRLLERNFALAPLLEVAVELAAEYGPRLSVLGGPPPTRAWHGDSSAREAAGALEIVAEGPDLADALADALGLLGRTLMPSEPVATRAQSRIATVSCTDEPAPLVAAVLSHVARGFALQHVVLGDVSERRRDVRLIGQESAVSGPERQLLGIATEPTVGGERVVLSVRS